MTPILVQVYKLYKGTMPIPSPPPPKKKHKMGSGCLCSWVGTEISGSLEGGCKG